MSKYPVVCHTVAWIERRVDWPAIADLEAEGAAYGFCEGCSAKVILGPPSQERLREGGCYPLCWECHGPDLANAIERKEPIAIEITKAGLERLQTHSGIPRARRKK